jgi:5'-methylthioadenosine phosphorylase
MRKENFMPNAGIIAGSGFYEIEGIEVKEIKKLTTPYGEPSDMYRICDISGGEVAFLSRHGTPHHIPPHRINYRANIWGFRELGVERILSVNAVGGINRELRPGDIVVPDQIIDMTHGRDTTFYDGDEVVHIDFTYPFCSELRGALISQGRKMTASLKEAGTYICVNGPRLESKAEIEYFSFMRGDVVGMTIMPEAHLARELEICYAGVAVVTNYAAGISPKRLTATEVVDVMKISMKEVKGLIAETLKSLSSQRACECKDALRDAKM